MRFLVLTSSRFGTASLCVPLLHEAGCNISRVVVSQSLPMTRRGYLRKKLTKILQIGLLGALNGLRMRSWYAGPPTGDIYDICRQLAIPVSETEHTNGIETIRLFEDTRADLGVSLGNSYISPKVFTIPSYGMINMHGERLPEYQNAQSVIWPIYNFETITGVTVHQLEKKIDAGAILYKKEIPIIFEPTLEATVRRTVTSISAIAPMMLCHVCLNYKVLLGSATPQKNGRSFTTPTFAQFRQMTRNNRFLFQQARKALALGRPSGG